jgi:hypothetical protein
MENSPLRFLDSDMAIMLGEEVRLSREEEAMKFHDNLFHFGIKINEHHHNTICKIYKFNNSLDHSRIKYFNSIVGYRVSMNLNGRDNVVKTIVKFYENRLTELPKYQLLL